VYSPPTSESALEKSGCNRVGYFKTTNRVGKESCLVIQKNGNGWSFIPYNRAFHRNCDGKPIERWAWRNGTQICSIDMDGCLSFTEQSKNYIYLHLAPYNPTATSQKWKITKSGEILDYSQFMCIFEESPFVKGNDYAETPMVMNGNRICSSWSFIPILNVDNQPICANFTEKKSYYYNNMKVY